MSLTIFTKTMNTPIKKRGQLISIEGIDGVGKNTQAKLLQQYIKKQKGECALFSFPRYETPTGKLVKDYLNSGRYDLSLLERAKLYADDRLAAKEELLSYLDNGIDVVCDRYVHSNIVYFEQFARMNQPEMFGVIGEEIRSNEFGINGLPQIDQLFTLSVSLNHYDAMMQSKDTRSYTTEKLDLHEADKELIKGCHELYGYFGKKEGVVFQCDFDGKLMSIPFISKVIQMMYEATQKHGTSITGVIVTPANITAPNDTGIHDGLTAAIIETDKLDWARATSALKLENNSISK